MKVYPSDNSLEICGFKRYKQELLHDAHDDVTAPTLLTFG